MNVCRADTAFQVLPEVFHAVHMEAPVNVLSGAVVHRAMLVTMIR